jgi:hypothetical protein
MCPVNKKDWAQEAAEDIAYEVRHGDGNEEDYRAIIVKHCPFKSDTLYMPVEQDVAYMPVPRCDRCKHWASASGACVAIKLDVPTKGSLLLVTAANFGCTLWEAK